MDNEHATCQHQIDLLKGVVKDYWDQLDAYVRSADYQNLCLHADLGAHSITSSMRPADFIAGIRSGAWVIQNDMGDFLDDCFFIQAFRISPQLPKPWASVASEAKFFTGAKVELDRPLTAAEVSNIVSRVAGLERAVRTTLNA